MEKRNIILILDSEMKYRQKITQYESIDVELFVSQLKKLGYNITITNYFNVINNLETIKNKIIVYTSDQRMEYKKYIEDIIYQLKEYNTLVPGYASLLGHENKCFQELERKKLKIDKLKSWVISDVRELQNININYPIVIKKPYSCSSRGVFIATGERELTKIIYSKFLKRDFRFYYIFLKKQLKKIIPNKNYNWTASLLDDYCHYSRFILEEYIPNLDGDFKVLVYGNKYYTLKRGVKTGDWKASGSGVHDYNIVPPKEVLDFARSCFNKLKIPFAGFDIAINENKECYLLEYQSIHIGPVTLINSKRYFTYENKKWITNEKPSTLELEYANAIDWYISNHVYK